MLSCTVLSLSFPHSLSISLSLSLSHLLKYIMGYTTEYQSQFPVWIDGQECYEEGKRQQRLLAHASKSHTPIFGHACKSHTHIFGVENDRTQTPPAANDRAPQEALLEDNSVEERAPENNKKGLVVKKRGVTKGSHNEEGTKKGAPPCSKDKKKRVTFARSSSAPPPSTTTKELLVREDNIPVKRTSTPSPVRKTGTAPSPSRKVAAGLGGLRTANRAAIRREIVNKSYSSAILKTDRVIPSEVAEYLRRLCSVGNTRPIGML
eukprot:sb/3468376/